MIAAAGVTAIEVTMRVSTVAVVGAGTIGASWAAHFLSRGLEVIATDPAPSAEAFVRAYVAQAWPTLEQLGGVAEGTRPDRLRFEPDPARAAAAADFVQESGPEREDLKIDLFAALDRAARPEIILASSSSGLLMSRIQSKCLHPERCIIGHPFNPPHLLPLVEVVGGQRTSPKVIAQALELYRSWGKRPIHIRKEVRGHVANRLQAALWREALHLLSEGVASVEDIDAAVAYGPGPRWAIYGPHLNFHLGGGAGGMEHFLKHLLGPFMSWWEDLGTPEVTPELQRKLIEGLEAEAAGRPIAELAAHRDRCLIAILRALEGHATGEPG